MFVFYAIIKNCVVMRASSVSLIFCKIILWKIFRNPLHIGIARHFCNNRCSRNFLFRKISSNKKFAKISFTISSLFFIFFWNFLLSNFSIFSIFFTRFFDCENISKIRKICKNFFVKNKIIRSVNFYFKDIFFEKFGIFYQKIFYNILHSKFICFSNSDFINNFSGLKFGKNLDFCKFFSFQ